MQETWRWFGPSDNITLRQIRQAYIGNDVAEI